MKFSNHVMMLWGALKGEVVPPGSYLVVLCHIQRTTRIFAFAPSDCIRRWASGMRSNGKTFTGLALYVPLASRSTIFCMGMSECGKSFVPNSRLTKALKSTPNGMSANQLNDTGSMLPIGTGCMSYSHRG